MRETATGGRDSAQADVREDTTQELRQQAPGVAKISEIAGVRGSMLAFKPFQPRS